jgi:hypothetical protein
LVHEYDVGKKKKKLKIGHKSKKDTFSPSPGFFSEVFCAILQGLKQQWEPIL